MALLSLRWIWCALALASLLSACAAPRSVYVGASDKNLYALSGVDGSLRWKQTLGGAVHTTPVHWAGNIIVAAADGVVYAFDADGGKPLWQRTLVSPVQAAAMAPQSVLSSPVMPINGRLYIGTGLGDVFEVGADAGATVLRAQLGVPGRQWLAPASDGSTVFVSSAAGIVAAVGTASGGVLWQQGLPTPVGPSAPAPNGGLAVPTIAGLSLLDAAHGGALVTTYTAAGLIEGVAVDPTSGLSYVVNSTGKVQQLAMGAPPGYSPIWTATPTNAAGYAPFYSTAFTPSIPMYVSFVDGTVASVTPNSGGVNWNQHVDVDLAAAPQYAVIGAANTAAVLVVSSAGHVYALDPANGSTVWKQTSIIGGSVDANVAAP